MNESELGDNAVATVATQVLARYTEKPQETLGDTVILLQGSRKGLYYVQIWDLRYKNVLERAWESHGRMRKE